LQYVLSYLISAKDSAHGGILREECIPTHPLNHMTTSHVTLWLFAEMYRIKGANISEPKIALEAAVYHLPVKERC
jgi:hypothetical protein